VDRGRIVGETPATAAAAVVVGVMEKAEKAVKETAGRFKKEEEEAKTMAGRCCGGWGV
jgi:hypothetical protein